MNDFQIYLHLGFKHIIDLAGSDHILFIVALTARYIWSDWKQLLILVTAFTIGHSVTLALSVLQWVNLPINLIELLIPVTIVLTALVNFGVKNFDFKSKYPIIYFFALFFGLIHGLGFSNYLRSLLGKEESILPPLFSFNLGLELGQLLIVSVILIISFIFVSLLKLDRRRVVQVISGIVFLLAANMVWERIVSFY
jgi:hydrogenase/urease accessory protein HupE